MGASNLPLLKMTKKALLKAWPMQCLGYKNENEFQDYVFNIIWDLWGFSYEEADEAVNGPLLKQENYLRVLMRLPEISSTDELAYRYVVSEEQFPKSSSLSGEEAHRQTPILRSQMSLLSLMAIQVRKLMKSTLLLG